MFIINSKNVVNEEKKYPNESCYSERRKKKRAQWFISVLSKWENASNDKSKNDENVVAFHIYIEYGIIGRYVKHVYGLIPACRQAGSPSPFRKGNISNLAIEQFNNFSYLLYD